MESEELALTHIDTDGAARMVDVSDKPKTKRVAAAVGRIFLQPATLTLIESNSIAKGNVLATARIAGIQAAKKTGGLIPLCHTLLLYHVQIDFEFEQEGILIRCEVRTIGRTGAEMEALAGVSIAALTIYDMCKAVDKTMRIGDLTLASKSKTAIAESI
jgi:cyclic pyranopterin phosphate synthase